MDNSALLNLQLNRNSKTLSTAQQEKLLEVIDKLLRVNFNPSRGSLLIVRAWSDGTYEQILSGDLRNGSASRCFTQVLKDHPRHGLRLVNDAHYTSSELVGLDASEMLSCENPGSFYYGKVSSSVGSLYAANGHYVLSLPLENGRIIVAFRARYCWRQDSSKSGISSGVSEPWQHCLFLTSLAETLRYILSKDQRLVDSFEEVLAAPRQRTLAGYAMNDALIRRCLTSRGTRFYKMNNARNSKMHYA